MAPQGMALTRTDSFESVCKEIHDSFKDDKLLTQILVNLSQSDCRKVRETYIKIYGEDLIQEISFLANLMLNPFERDAVVAREALHQYDSVNYKALVEIFTCRKSSHVLLILQAYQAKYRKPLDLDIASIEPSHPYQKMLMALSASHKAHNADLSQHIAKCDARRLYQTGEGKPGSVDEAVVLEIFSKRSIEQLKLTFFSYKHIYGHSYKSFLKNEDFGGFEDALRVVAKCICSPTRYYAETLYGCLKGTSNDKGALVRIMVSQAEVDMDEIQRYFKKKYGVDLKNVVCESIPEGSYRGFLVALATKTSTSYAFS